MTKTTIYVKTQFTGFHCWPAAPAEVAFLRNLHRHVFHVEVHLKVVHDDRDVEFFMFKEDLDRIIKQELLPSLVINPHQSCEMLAKSLYEKLQTYAYLTENPRYPYFGLTTKIIVSEDGENGAVIEII